MGRPLIPTNVKILHGNQGKRALNTEEPQPDAKPPKMPVHVAIEPEAAREWRRILPILKRMRVLTEADGALLADYCIAHAMCLRLLEKIRELNSGGSGIAGLIQIYGAGKDGATGYIQVNQLYSAYQQTCDRKLKYLREFGFSPGARSRMRIEQEKKQPQGGLLNGQWRQSYPRTA